MAISAEIRDREFDKFVDIASKPVVRVTDVAGNSMVPSVWDYLKVTYPLGTTEVYTFKTGGSGGTTVSTVTVVYTDSTKANVDTVTRT
jgi:hypothetical protein